MLWFENSEIAIFFSQKSDGDMLFKSSLIGADLKLITAATLNEKVRRNRISFFKKHNIAPLRLVNFAGVHSAHIAMIHHNDMGRGALAAETRIPKTDGLITNIRNSYLMVTGADCFPVLFYDEKRSVIGALHAGWKGIIKGINLEMLSQFQNEFDSNPADINVWIGPGIKSCHYSVDKERAELFSKNYKNHIIERGEQIFLDLAGIIASQLTGAGVKSGKIITHPDCTFCEEEKYFSYRRDKPEIIKANAYIIHLK